MLNIRDALGLAFFFYPLSLFLYIGCRLPRVVIGDVKSNEYRSKVSELRFELHFVLQREAPAARHPYRENAREGRDGRTLKNARARAIMQNDLSVDRWTMDGRCRISPRSFSHT